MSVTLLAQMLALAAISGTRASMAVLGLAIFGRFFDMQLPGELSFLTTDAGLGVLVALVVVDEVVERDPDLQSLLSLINVAVRGAAGAVSAWGLHGAFGGTLPAPAVWVLGAVVAGAVYWVRSELNRYLPDTGEGWLNPRTWVAWLEIGGALGVLAAVFLAPFLALAFVVFGGVAATIAMFAVRKLERTYRRRPCPQCGHPAREEACRCPSCHAAVPIVRTLGGAVPGVGTQ